LIEKYKHFNKEIFYKSHGYSKEWSNPDLVPINFKPEEYFALEYKDITNISEDLYDFYVSQNMTFRKVYFFKNKLNLTLFKIKYTGVMFDL
jgi:hypothetical protein